MRRHQSGFTLVEIAIVLVIIGLLLGGVLKGQELINSAKVKNLATDFRNLPVFIYGYQDKFKRLPGDDKTASDRFSTGTTIHNGDGSGSITGTWNADASGSTSPESVLFWQHVRAANLAPGSTDMSTPAKASLPTNAEGGRFGIQMTSPITNLTGQYFACSGGIPFALAQQLDQTLDDGVGTTGNMRAFVTAAADGAATDAVAYATGSSYTVCQSF